MKRPRKVITKDLYCEVEQDGNIVVIGPFDLTATNAKRLIKFLSAAVAFLEG